MGVEAAFRGRLSTIADHRCAYNKLSRGLVRMLTEHRMGRNYLWFRRGDAINAILAAAGYNFRRLIRWLSSLLSQILIALIPALQPVPA
jgi:hypothetical protein